MLSSSRNSTQCSVGKWKSLSHVWPFATLRTIQSMKFSRPEYWVSSLSLLQGIFPTQGLNPGLPHCRQILYQLSHKGSPRILEWVTYPFSSGSSQPRNRTGVSCIAGRFFTNWTDFHGEISEKNKGLLYYNIKSGTSLVVHWLRLCAPEPVQWGRFDPWSGSWIPQATTKGSHAATKTQQTQINKR